MNKSGINKSCSALCFVLSYIPSGIKEAVLHYIEGCGQSESEINEIRLRIHSTCSIVVGGRNIPLGKSVGKDELRECFKNICGGAVYAHRDGIGRGYISLEHGIRVGVCGHAGYEDGHLIGVSDISALVFRIPSGECSFAYQLFREWRMRDGGMLICSAAGEGKTTAIRSLARLIGSGKDRMRVVVVDERCEFDPEAYPDSEVDILRGYRRSLGVDIAVRTMSSEVLIVDEIGSTEDALAMMSAIGAGVRVIATAHGVSLADAMKREYVRKLVEGGLFDSAVLIRRSDGRFSFSIEDI